MGTQRLFGCRSDVHFGNHHIGFIHEDQFEGLGSSRGFDGMFSHFESGHHVHREGLGFGGDEHRYLKGHVDFKIGHSTGFKMKFPENVRESKSYHISRPESHWMQKEQRTLRVLEMEELL